MPNGATTIDVTIRLSDAIYGTTTTVERNGRRLEVKIPPGAQVVRLTNALQITDGVPGNLAIRVNIAVIPVPNVQLGADLDLLFQTCLSDIGGGNNADIQAYIGGRSNQISRRLFFEKATRAIWVSGMKRKSARAFLQRAQANGFNFNYVAFGSYDNQQLDMFMRQMHGQAVPGRAAAKWQAVHFVAQWLQRFANDGAFQRAVFAGKRWGRELDENDIQNLVSQRLPFIRKANASYIVRGMGGEAIKDDRWIKGFRSWGQLTLAQLETRLQALEIPWGFFDIVIWAYCEQIVKKTDRLNQHFTAKFGYLR